jgi:hypothetical protein
MSLILGRGKAQASNQPRWGFAITGASVPHPFRFVLRKGWETNQLRSTRETSLQLHLSSRSLE